MHNFTVTNLNDSPFYLDCFIYDTTEDTAPYLPAPTVSSGTVQTAPEAPFTSPLSSHSTVSPSTTDGTQQSSNSSSAPPIGSIIGGVLGGLSLLISIALSFYLLGRLGLWRGRSGAPLGGLIRNEDERVTPNAPNDSPTSNILRREMTTAPPLGKGTRDTGLLPYSIPVHGESSIGDHSSSVPTEFPSGISGHARTSLDTRSDALLVPRAEMRERAHGNDGRGDQGDRSWSGSEVTSFASPPPAYKESGMP